MNADVTIRYNSNSGLLGVRPVLEDLSDFPLVLNADILRNERDQPRFPISDSSGGLPDPRDASIYVSS